MTWFFAFKLMNIICYLHAIICRAYWYWWHS